MVALAKILFSTSKRLPKRTANYAPLNPTQFVERAAKVYPKKIAVAHGSRRYTWELVYRRSMQLAAACLDHGIRPRENVGTLLSNVPEMLEAHYALPMAGIVITPFNTRTDAAMLRHLVLHSGIKALLVDREFAPTAEQALAEITVDCRPLVIDVTDSADGLCESSRHAKVGSIDYEDFLTSGGHAMERYALSGAPASDHPFQPHWASEFMLGHEAVTDEWMDIALNYTSGTTGNPKGVVLHHRGAYLNAMNNHMVWSLPQHFTYLWTLPMFHCNGWCFPWTVAALAGTHVCLRKVDGDLIHKKIKDEGVTHMCGAPIVIAEMLRTMPPGGLARPVRMMTAASAPPEAVLTAATAAGLDITHVYGLTEVYGPATVCAWHEEWNHLPMAEQARLQSRQGVRYHALDGLIVGDPTTCEEVPHDGQTLGEILFRGNLVMKGYKDNDTATEEALHGGWFHSGDLAVTHPDGYIQIRDRSKDIIISGGENISSLEVEDVLYKHPEILEAAVVAKADEKWGEVPCAFVVKRDSDSVLSEDDVIQYCKSHLPRFMAPKLVSPMQSLSHQ